MPGARAGLHLGHEDHRAPVAAAPGDEHLALAGDAALGADQRGLSLDPAAARRAERPPRSTIDDRRIAVDRVAVDAVAGEPGDLGDGRVEIGQHLQRAVAEPVAAGAGGEHRLHQRAVEHALVAAADADGDRLGLVLDRVDRPGQLLDRARQRGGEIVDQRARRADLARLGAGSSSSGASRQRVAQQRRSGAPRSTPRGGRRSTRCAARRGTGRRTAPMLGTHAAQHVVARRCVARRRCSIDLARLAQRAGRRVDRQRRLVAEQVADHRREHERQRRIDRRHGDHRRRGGEALVALGRRSRSASPCGPGRSPPPWPTSSAVPPDEAGRAHEDQRLATTGRCASCPR